MSNPLLFEFYQQLMLDKEWINPGLEGYFLLDTLMESPHFKPKTFQDLAQALETIWLKSQHQQGRFRQLLEERRTHLLEILAAGEQEKTPARPASMNPPPGQPAATVAIPEPLIEDPLAAYESTETPKEKPEANATAPADRQLDLDGAPGFSLSYSEADASEAFVLQQQLEKDKQSEIDRPYFFTNDYFPIRNRQLQQVWRSLITRKTAGDGREISVPRTIRRTADQGYFSNFAYQKKTANQLQLFILIDESDTMIAVEGFGRELCDAAVASNRYENLKPLYFDRLPVLNQDRDDYLVTYDSLAPNTTLGKVFAPFARKNILVLIYSDAGVFRNELDQQRVQQSKEFIRWICQRTGYIAWLNPAPRHRWEGTNAGELLTDTPMFEAGKGEFENAIAALKGKSIH